MTKDNMTGIPFEKLWQDKRYIRLRANKDKRWTAFVEATAAAGAVAEPFKARFRADAVKAEEAHTRALKRIYAYEEKARVMGKAYRPNA